MDKQKLDEFLKELKDIFEKYNKDVPLIYLIHSADLCVDTMKKELKL